MKKQHLRAIVLLTSLAAVTAVVHEPAAAEAIGAKPNIILFLTDDQDKESIGAYGADVLTPNLDRLAREGMLFHRAYVSSTVCTPSRYTFLTGRYAGRSYSPMYHEACPPGTQGFPSFNVELEDDNMNVGAVLQQAGYTTGYVGKFHVGPELKRPEHYEHFGLRFLPTDAQPDAAATAVFRHNEAWYRDFLTTKGFSWAKHIYWGNLQKPFAEHNPEWTIAAALEFIQENRDRPFYLHYCTTLLHGPDRSWRNSMDHPRASGAGLLDEPPDVMTDRSELLGRLAERGLDPMAGHAGNTWVDDSIGAVLNKLDELGIAQNTLFVFIADHGSRMKGSLFDFDGTNVPCIIRWPAGVKARSACRELIENIDFAPTFFDLAGADVPAEYVVDGRSLRPLFTGDEPDEWRDHLYFEAGFARAVVTDTWKYIAVRYPHEQIEAIQNARPEQLPRLMAYINRSGIGTRGSSNSNFFDADQLYNIARDERELKNLAGDPAYATQLARMRRLLTDDLKTFGRPFGEFVPGGNVAPPGLVDEQIDYVKRIKIEGKKVILPDGRTVDEKAGTARQQRQAERDRRRAAKRGTDSEG